MTTISEKGLDNLLRAKLKNPLAFTILYQNTHKSISISELGLVSSTPYGHMSYLDYDNTFDTGNCITLETLAGGPSNTGFKFQQQGSYEIEMSTMVNGTYMTTMRLLNYTQYKAGNNSLAFQGMADRAFYQQEISPIIHGNYPDDDDEYKFGPNSQEKYYDAIEDMNYPVGTLALNLSTWHRCNIKSFITIDATNINDQFAPVFCCSNRGVKGKFESGTPTLFRNGQYGHNGPIADGNNNGLHLVGDTDNYLINILSDDGTAAIPSGLTPSWSTSIKRIVNN